MKERSGKTMIEVLTDDTGVKSQEYQEAANKLVNSWLIQQEEVKNLKEWKTEVDQLNGIIATAESGLVAENRLGVFESFGRQAGEDFTPSITSAFTRGGATKKRKFAEYEDGIMEAVAKLNKKVEKLKTKRESA